MLSFSGFRTKKQLAEMVLKYNLNLSEIAEAMAHAPNHELTEEMLNEFLGKAMQAIGGAVKGAFQGAKNAWQGAGSEKKQAEKAVQDFYNAITKMGISQDSAKTLTNNLQNWLSSEKQKISGQNQQVAPAAQNQQAAGVNVKPVNSSTPITASKPMASQPVRRANVNVQITKPNKDYDPRKDPKFWKEFWK
jgi:hypothetical protein